MKKAALDGTLQPDPRQLVCVTHSPLFNFGAHAAPFERSVEDPLRRDTFAGPDVAPGVAQSVALTSPGSRAALIHCCGKHSEPKKKTSWESDSSDRVYSA